MTHCVWKKHTVHKGTLSGVLFALIVREKFPSVTAIDAMDKYQVWVAIRVKGLLLLSAEFFFTATIQTIRYI